MCIFCAGTVKENVQLLLNISCFLRNVWLLLGVFRCFLRNRRLFLKDINERLLLKENVQLIFFCVWLLLETFQCCLMNVRLLLKRYQWTTASERKMCFLELCPLKKCFVNWKQIKIKKHTMKTYSSFQKPVTFMYFWLN